MRDPASQSSASSIVKRLPWAITAVLCGTVFFIVAMSAEVYHDTSPRHVATEVFGSGAADVPHPFGFSLHVTLRKAYSVVAFAIVGILSAKALPSSTPAIAIVLLIALYSAGIEYGQWLHGSKEGLVWNVIDTACGALGGALAVIVLRLGSFSHRFATSLPDGPHEH